MNRAKRQGVEYSEDDLERRQRINRALAAHGLRAITSGDPAKDRRDFLEAFHSGDESRLAAMVERLTVPIKPIPILPNGRPRLP